MIGADGASRSAAVALSSQGLALNCCRQKSTMLIGCSVTLGRQMPTRAQNSLASLLRCGLRSAADAHPAESGEQSGDLDEHAFYLWRVVCCWLLM